MRSSSSTTSPMLLSTLCSSSTWWLQRRFVRVFAVGFIFLVAVSIHLTRGDSLPAHHAPFEAPTTKLVVHGDVIDALPELAEPLEPFPPSPRYPPEQDDDHAERAPWLAAVISTASDVERRMIIRSTWMKLFQDVPFDGRFVVSNPGPQWTRILSQENRTFGDLIVLDHIPEDDITANTIKTLEFYKWLVAHSPKYEFVSKMDTDLWLNARGFWERFLLPRLSRSNETGTLTSTVERTVVGELYYSPYWDLVFPHGAMYTVTWDMVELLSSLQGKFKVVTGEDMAVATLMLKGHERANFVNFRGTEKFDYNDNDAREDEYAWARQNTHPYSIDHAIVGQDAIAVHQLKDEKLWFKVADCFDETGVKEAPMSSKGYKSQKPMSMRWHDFWSWMGVSTRYQSRFDRIPDFIWTVEDGDWICDGIWNVGKTKTGFTER
ncbi:putative beta-1,3-N-acetylgalactosaminyltransferase 2 [Colletotrichum musicola]|uniref:Hexosyltransferase n=1 Tax=Colletotrichum musicola TaxID=2175873 RepID=A0A8H6NWP2_9PEZI|nr:putative beta-1,3-N-acetylgalactosaminyltransferase 2 [Colletotrichum musicola]